MSYTKDAIHDTQEQAQQNADSQVESDIDDNEYDRYKDNPDLLGVSMSKTTRLFSFDWANGYISPFRPTPQDILQELFREIEFNGSGNDSILDFGCGDGLVLLQALRTFPQSQLTRSVGVDLDRALLEASRDKILLEQSESSSASNFSILSRLELYHGDLLKKDDPLSPILTPSVFEKRGSYPKIVSSIARMSTPRESHSFDAVGNSRIE
ncbi:hypothetical protein BGZ76_011349 [Entomortierella beljakovae]|nr:hypothetical protein BGZ76_011349 [Entomortierella beljakovae]